MERYHKKIKYTYQVICRYLATHLNYYIGINETRKCYESRDIKFVSKTKTKNCWSKIDQGLNCAKVAQ